MVMCVCMCVWFVRVGFGEGVCVRCMCVCVCVWEGVCGECVCVCVEGWGSCPVPLQRLIHVSAVSRRPTQPEETGACTYINYCMWRAKATVIMCFSMPTDRPGSQALRRQPDTVNTVHLVF